MIQAIKKGKGSISRVSFEGEELKYLEDFELEMNKNEDKDNIQLMPKNNLQPFQIFVPSNIDKQNKNEKVEITSDMDKIVKNITQIDYKGLARALKNFIKNKKKLNLFTEQSKNSLDNLNISTLLNPKNVKSNILIEEMPLSEIIEEKQLVEGRKERLENKTNRNLLNYENNSKAFVNIIREGLARQSDSGYTFVASITLIKDEGKIILIDIVVTTHGHDAIHYQNRTFSLTKNINLIKTPGHTQEDISVVVKNTERYGTVIVSGDVFMTAEDIDLPIMWRPLSLNELEQENSRKLIICCADYIVPGHGKIFKINKIMKERFNCNENERKKRKKLENC
uniref:Metallo-beta-lactamase domain-containing protein n=2 Tax=Meloidogyne TaxID=189290 RepID=A0A915NV26_9BILA